MRPVPKKSLLDVLLSRLGREKPNPQPARVPLRPFQAISIFRGVTSCPAAKQLSEHRFLARDAPPLPLPGCSMRAQCQCRYLKHSDRRSGPRRLLDFGLSARLFDGRERRQRGGRRTED